MRIAPLFEVKNKLSELVKETASGPVVITKNGKPCAALVRVDENEDMECFVLSHHPRFLKLIDDAVEKTREHGGTPLSGLMKGMRKVRTLAPSRRASSKRNRPRDVR